MINSGRNNAFYFNFPKEFVPEAIVKRYKPILDKIPGNMITEPIDFINYSVQSVNLPGMTYTPTEQTNHMGTKKHHRDAIPVEELKAKEMTITFQKLDGYINYWMMYDIMMYYYADDNSKLYLPEGTAVRILDEEGFIIITATLERLLFNEISELNLSFSENMPDFNTFECTFTYNKLNIKNEIDGGKI